MASVMGICGGLVGPKSENVEKALVDCYCLRGQECRDGQTASNGAAMGRFEVEKGRFVIKNALCRFRIVLPTQAGNTFAEIS